MHERIYQDLAVVHVDRHSDRNRGRYLVVATRRRGRDLAGSSPTDGLHPDTDRMRSGQIRVRELAETIGAERLTPDSQSYFSYRICFRSHPNDFNNSRLALTILSSPQI